MLIALVVLFLTSTGGGPPVVVADLPGCKQVNKDNVCVCPSNCGERKDSNGTVIVADGCGHDNKPAAACGGAPNAAGDKYLGVVQTNGACTPFAFLPHRQTCAGNPCSDIARDKDPPIIWKQTPDSSDFWIFHGCDGSGIQTDCIGDVLYLEHFYTKENEGIGHDLSIKEDSCKKGAHGACGFKHPGKSPVDFPYYMSGRWTAGHVSEESAGNLKTSHYLMGVARKENWEYVLSKCPKCNDASQKKGLMVNPYAYEKPDRLIVGNLQPWVCTNNKNDGHEYHQYYSPVAGQTVDWKCYSDDEAWNGQTCRHSDPKDCTPNWNTQFLYCGLYKAKGELKCRLYRARKDQKTCGSECKCDCPSHDQGTNCNGKCATKCGLCGYMEEIGGNHFDLYINGVKPKQS